MLGVRAPGRPGQQFCEVKTGSFGPFWNPGCGVFSAFERRGGHLPQPPASRNLMIPTRQDMGSPMVYNLFGDKGASGETPLLIPLPTTLVYYWFITHVVPHTGGAFGAETDGNGCPYRNVRHRHVITTEPSTKASW